LERNVRVFPCAAAAETAGFRPCRRCRPEASAGTPAWSGASTTVSRALRLIDEGALDGSAVDALAARLGVGERHLRRLFRQHLGATPSAIAQTRRLHFARRLVDQTRLPMAEIAACSGFSSIRRFNAALRQAYGAAPSHLRSRGPAARAIRARGALPTEARLILRLPYRPPYDWDGMLQFLAARAIPGVEEVIGDCYRRAVPFGSGPVVVEVRPDARASELVLSLPTASPAELLEVVQGARRLFDLDADPLQIASHLRTDPILAPLLRRHPGARVPGAWDRAEIAVRVIVAQQVSVQAATTVVGRIARALGTPLPRPDGSITHAFPAAEHLAGSRLDGLGLTRRRAASVRGLARAIQEGRVELAPAADFAATLDRLQQLEGIGPWTAHLLAMRVFGEPDAFPAGDLGLRKALAAGGALPAVGTVEALAEAWRPWRAYALMLLWRKAAAETRRTPQREPRSRRSRSKR
jgi:AraC family transcriptional regulator of adaptative response / DNA-3-methyladenine glycosylase II